MQSCQVLPSTTSHKKEPLLPTLEVFARLGFQDLDLNLHHLIEAGVRVDVLKEALAAGRQRVLIVSGGWCDFFHAAPRIEETFQSVARQVAIADALGADRLRLFFGRLSREAYSPSALTTIAGNLRRLSDTHPGMQFVFENHDGASLDPAICGEILTVVAKPNIRMNFDPINFERAGVGSLDALGQLLPVVGHVHLKGLDGGEYCEFGEGQVDLAPVLRMLIESDYRGGFTVEYEGPFDGTLRLYRSVQRAQDTVQALIHERR